MSEILTRADVERIAALARLELTDDEATLFAAQLTAILGYADQIQRVDTASVAAAALAPPAATVLRDDEPVPSLPRDLLFGQAPAAGIAPGLFKVPRVLGS